MGRNANSLTEWKQKDSKTLNDFENNEKNNLRDFFSWIIENKCYLVEILVSKFDRIYKTDNPFEQDYYILDPNTFLYNRGYIQTYPKYVENLEFKLKRNVSIIPLNEYKYRSDD